MTANSLPHETFYIVSTISDWKGSMTAFAVNNTGAVPVQLVEMYLYRSDNTLVNSTSLSLPAIMPSEVSVFNVTLSYDLAKTGELYYIVVVSSDGTAAASLPQQIFCNCSQ
jgi:hypothetical protein